MPKIKNDNKDEFVISSDDGGHDELILRRVYPGDHEDRKHDVFKKAS